MPGHPLGRIMLGNRLRQLREAAGLSRLDAAHAVKKRNEDSIRHFETGTRLIGELELDVLGRFYGCSPDVVTELERLYALARRPGEFASFGLPEAMMTFLELERSALLIRTFQNLIIPGMLQAEPYMRRLFQLAGVDAGAIDQHVRARLKRQERLRLSASDPVRLLAVIGEEALRRCAREPEIAAAQFAELVEFANQPNVEIRIMDLDAGLHTGVQGEFTLLTFPEGTINDLVYQQMASGGQANDTASVVNRLKTQFDELRNQALSADESLSLMTQLADTHG